MTGYIYCHISPSGEKYIGQTTTSLEHRYNNGKNYISSLIFWKAIQKYGWDNFKHIVLRTITSNNKEELINLLNNAEREEIEKNNSLIPNGYNIELGGGQGRVTKEKAMQISKTMLQDRTPSKELLEKLYIEENKTTEEISNILKVHRNIISKWLKWYNIPINYKHRTTKKISKEEFEKYYINENYTQKECANYFDIDLNYVPRLVKEFNLYKRRLK